MGRLFIVAGAAGQGKKFFFDKFDHLMGVELIKKYTTRKDVTNVDLIGNFSADEIIKKCKYRYEYGENNELYGIDKRDIDQKLAENKNPLVIVRSCKAIEAIKRDYLDAVCINVQSCLGEAEYRRKMEENKWEDIDIQERMRRANADFEEYRDYINLFDYNILNRFDDTINTQIQHIVSKIKDINRENIFVIMPFSPEYDNVYNAIQTAENVINNKFGKNKLRIYRMTSDFGSYMITERIYNAIDEAAIIIADVSEVKRPNVYFELGYAKSKNKEMIIVARKGSNDYVVENLRKDEQNGSRITVLEYESEVKLGRKLVDLVASKLNLTEDKSEK